MTHPVGANQVLKGASTLYDEEGKVRLQWVKSQPEIEDKIEVFAQVVEELTTGLKPLPVVEPPKHNDLDLLTLYTFTDYHLGALAQAKETGADWDVKIAEKTLWTALTQMMESSPSSQTAIFNLQGDWQHFDSLEAVTPTSGHLLDADTRLEKLVELSIKLAMSSVIGVRLVGSEMCIRASTTSPQACSSERHSRPCLPTTTGSRSTTPHSRTTRTNMATSCWDSTTATKRKTKISRRCLHQNLVIGRCGAQANTPTSIRAITTTQSRIWQRRAGPSWRDTQRLQLETHMPLVAGGLVGEQPGQLLTTTEGAR